MTLLMEAIASTKKRCMKVNTRLDFVCSCINIACSSKYMGEYSSYRVRIAYVSQTCSMVSASEIAEMQRAARKSAKVKRAAAQLAVWRDAFPTPGRNFWYAPALQVPLFDCLIVVMRVGRTTVPVIGLLVVRL